MWQTEDTKTTDHGPACCLCSFIPTSIPFHINSMSFFSLFFEPFFLFTSMTTIYDSLQLQYCRHPHSILYLPSVRSIRLFPPKSNLFLDFIQLLNFMWQMVPSTQHKRCVVSKTTSKRKHIKFTKHFYIFKR